MLIGINTNDTKNNSSNDDKKNANSSFVPGASQLTSLPVSDRLSSLRQVFRVGLRLDHLQPFWSLVLRDFAFGVNLGLALAGMEETPI